MNDEMAGWTLGLDGVAFGTFDRQGGLRGATQFISQNWFMVMASRDLSRGTLTLTGMASAEPVSVGRAGYSQILQEGEAYKGSWSRAISDGRTDRSRGSGSGNRTSRR